MIPVNRAIRLSRWCMVLAVAVMTASVTFAGEAPGHGVDGGHSGRDRGGEHQDDSEIPDPHVSETLEPHNRGGGQDEDDGGGRLGERTAIPLAP